MYRTTVLVADASRARLFSAQDTGPSDSPRPALVERYDLVDPARRIRPHDAELDTAFAKLIIEALTSELRMRPAQRLIVCATPHMLGHLRQAGRHLWPGRALEEVPRDLVACSPSELVEHLHLYNLMPGTVGATAEAVHAR